MKKKRKKEKSRNKNFLTELETVTYEQQLIDNNRQLARLRADNEELETKVENLNKTLNELEENKADLTSHLQQKLQKKTEQAQELHEKLLAFEKLHNHEQQTLKKKEELLEHEFRTMEQNLTDEIKLAAGKLNTLEEWRVNRIDLMKKFEEQEKHIVEQEIHHKNILYEAEKKFIIGKAKMQNELENRLRELAESFQAATSLRLADATQRAMRENISLHRELNRLLDHSRELDSDVQDYKERERIWRLHSSLYEAETHLALEKVAKQTQAIEHLSNEHVRMCKAIGWALRGEKYALLGEKVLEEVKTNCIEVQNKTCILEQNVEHVRINRKDTMREVLDNCLEIQRLDGILARAKKVIQRSLLIQTEINGKEDACSERFNDEKERLLQSLIEILEGYHDSIIEDEEKTETEPLENLYEFGNLGLIPTFLGINASYTSKVEPLSSRNNVNSLLDREERKVISNNSATNSQCWCD